MKTRSINSRTLIFVISIVSVIVLLFTMDGMVQRSAIVQAQPNSSNDAKPLGQGEPPCADCGCPNTCPCTGVGKCVDASCAQHACTGGGGGSNPPQPTQPPSGGGGTPGGGGGVTPQATTVAWTGPTATPVVCGDGNCTDWETYANCSADCDPPDWHEGEFTMYCAPYSGCDSGWANLTAVYIPASDSYVIIDYTCLDESACVPATPLPNVTPESPGIWPCDYPPTVDASGVIRQPCKEWPGWYIDVEVRIPPSGILRNPWPRGLVGMENCFWYLGNADNEKWSEEMALECPNAANGVTHDDSVFDCGNGTTVVEGATANYQIGAAWRQWRDGDDPVFGYMPPGEITWMFDDREWNGGKQMKVGPNVCYTFETSSYGLGEWGPVWNPDCQDEECDCDERIQDYLGSPSYMVNATTFWWPEYSFKYLEYGCSHKEWTGCACWSEEPHGQGQRRGCSAPPGICTGATEWYGEVGRCDEWKWKETQDAWTPYDLTMLGFTNPMLPFVGVTVAGADAEGNRCSEFTDRWPCYIPVPVIEVQPASE